VHINLFIMLDYVLQKASTVVHPHFIDVWVPMHRDDPEDTQKLVSNYFNSIYVCIVCFIHVKLTFVQDRYTEELRKTHSPDTDLRSVPFDVNAAYHAGGGLPHGRYVESNCLRLRIIKC
jgi:hypothetical protein